MDRTRQSLLRRSTPRLQMAFFVAITGLAGLGASVALRRLGVEQLGWRYGLAVACAYACFLLLLRAWLIWQQRRSLRGTVRDRGAGSGLDLPDLPLDPPAREPVPWNGSGGEFVGGGASGDLPPPDAVAYPGVRMESLSRPSGGRGSGGGGLDLDLDLDALVAVVLAAAALACVLFAAGYVVSEAPTLFADLLVDGAISAGLYRRLRRGGGSGSWWSGVVRRTRLPVGAVLVFFVAAGTAIQHAWPEAHTLGEAWRLLVTRIG